MTSLCLLFARLTREDQWPTSCLNLEQLDQPGTSSPSREFPLTVSQPFPYWPRSPDSRRSSGGAATAAQSPHRSYTESISPRPPLSGKEILTDAANTFVSTAPLPNPAIKSSMISLTSRSPSSVRRSSPTLSLPFPLLVWGGCRDASKARFAHQTSRCRARSGSGSVGVMCL